jgi:hypothetical protein
MRFTVFTFVLLIFVFPVCGQEMQITELITDRPDQTESASLVPQGNFQIETGFVYEADQTVALRSDNLALFSTLLRYGVNRNFELRLGSAFLHRTNDPEQSEKTSISGLAPWFAGLKLKMAEQDGVIPEMAFLLTAEFPGTGKTEFSPDHIATDLRFSIEYTLTDRLGLGVNLGGQWDCDEGRPAGLYSLVLGIGLANRLGVFIESYGFLPTNRMPDHRMDAGVTWLVKNNLQLDFSGGFGLSDVSPDYFINAGFSWRIPD